MTPDYPERLLLVVKVPIATLAFTLTSLSSCAVVLDATDGRVDIDVVVEPAPTAAMHELAIVMWSAELVPCSPETSGPRSYASAVWNFVVPSAHAHSFEAPDYVVRSTIVDLTEPGRMSWITLQPMGQTYCGIEILARSADESTPDAASRGLVGHSYAARTFIDGEEVRVAGTETLAFALEFDRPFDPATEDRRIEVRVSPDSLATMQEDANLPMRDQLRELLTESVAVVEAP